MGHKINRDRKGNPFVAYQCPHCRSDLQTALHEAGQTQKCPTCQTPHDVPGLPDYEAFVLAENNRREREENQRRLKAEQAAQVKVAQIHRDRERQIAKEQRHALAASRRAQLWRSPLTAIAVSFAITVAVLYFGFIRPLKNRADVLQVKLEAATDLIQRNADRERDDFTKQQQGLSRERIALASLTATVNQNADAANNTAHALASLTATVNHNAEAANATSRSLAALTTTVNHNADAANETSRALSSLTATVNYNAEIANLNNMRP